MDEKHPRRGPESAYNAAAVFEIARWLASGRSLREIVELARSLPRSRVTLRKWLRAHPEAALLLVGARHAHASDERGQELKQRLDGGEQIDPDTVEHLRRHWEAGWKFRGLLGDAETDEKREEILAGLREHAHHAVTIDGEARALRGRPKLDPDELEFMMGVIEAAAAAPGAGDVQRETLERLRDLDGSDLLE